MARTFRDIAKHKQDKLGDRWHEQYRDWYIKYGVFTDMEYPYLKYFYFREKRINWEPIYNYYNKNPMWWNHIYSIEKARSVNRQFINKIMKGDWEDFYPWHNYKKPTAWYW